MFTGRDSWVDADGDPQDIRSAIIGLNPSGPDGIVGVVHRDGDGAPFFRCFIREDGGPEHPDPCVLWTGQGTAFLRFIQDRLPSRVSVLGSDPGLPQRVWVVTRQSDRIAWRDTRSAEAPPVPAGGWVH